MKKVRLATVWLDGCAGCHMSLLDIDEALIDLAQIADIVYGPLVDIKEFPHDVDVTLVEGAVSSTEDLEKAQVIRERSKLVVAFGDCAVTSNVPSMRNQYGVAAVMKRAYQENATLQPQMPTQGVPALLPVARPLHNVIAVDLHIPGCPPSPEVILNCVSELCAGRMPKITPSFRFG